MIEIKLANDDAKKGICELLNFEATDDLNIYVAKERGNVLGCCGFKFLKENGEIAFANATEPSLIMIEDGLLRAALFYMFEKGVLKAECSGNVEPKMLTRLGFKQNEGKYILDLEHSFLTAGCSCGDKK